MIKRNDGIENFRANKVTYNRNGISGRPFYSVAFSFEEDGTFHPNMLAVLSTDGKEDEICVVDMNDVEANWRGPNFFRLVSTAIDAHRGNFYAKLNAG